MSRKPASTHLSADEWASQAQRDLRAAEHLLSGDFHAHAAVVAQLSVEKALKAWYRASTGETPPVTHDVRVLADRLTSGVDGWSQDLQDALDTVADVTIVSLYQPDRPFGHPVSDHPAHERVAAARTLLGWIQGHTDAAA